MANQKMLLDGVWDFAFSPKPADEVAPEELSFDYLMPVPGCFDSSPKYNFRRGSGFFRRQVCCCGPVKLEIGAVGLRGKVFWDGREIGKCLYPFAKEEFTFDAGEYGTHELVIATENIFDESDSSLFRSFYDYYAHGGIFRSIKLRELPDVYVDYAAVLPLDLDGKVKMQIELGGGVSGNCRILASFDGKEPVALELSGGRGEFILQVPDPQIWSPENPALHELELAAGEDRWSAKFGIRTVAAEKGKILLNGKPIKLYGYNRHDCNPDTGYALCDADLLHDLQMIKEQGCNFIRGSHYPQSDTMLDLCDKLGLLVWEESTAWGDRPESMRDAEFCRRQCAETGMMVRKSINHPSVILWGFLNEGATDVPEAVKLVEDLCRIIRGLDSSRLITFASNRIEKDLCLHLADVISFNGYPSWYNRSLNQFFDEKEFNDCWERYASFVSQPEYIDKPLLIGESGAAAIPGTHHGMRWSEEYQAQVAENSLRIGLTHPRYSGVGIWQFCDTRSYVSYGASVRPRGFNNKGLVDEYRRPKLAWQTVTRILKELKEKQII